MREQRRLYDSDLKSETLLRAEYHFAHQEIEELLDEMHLFYRIGSITGKRPKDFFVEGNTLVYRHPDTGPANLEVRLERQESMKQTDVRLTTNLNGSVHTALMRRSTDKYGKVPSNRFYNYTPEGHEHVHRLLDALQAVLKSSEELYAHQASGF